ncbi:uncharacterized protein KQ657_001049 [Scheffersomyces spartinae]|uniref:RNI-like protein n=1 Tax=Scheffersomyces spartinae TaxID=45513 RepID=A0A9P7V8E5_9ASCO|nr:uncharacterized protein KQ657_001049 [Scheffersomyces spartinae]KAG7193286.1 hypothetical protein KQ657_001049 [Scheffersomyces spartinae]
MTLSLASSLVSTTTPSAPSTGDTETAVTEVSTMEPTLDLGEIKRFLNLEEWEDGVKNTDVDWFLSSLAIDFNTANNNINNNSSVNVSGSSTPSNISSVKPTPPPTKSEDNSQKKPSSESSSSPLKSSTLMLRKSSASSDLEVRTSPHISTPISNTNLNNFNKTKPSTTLSGEFYLPETPHSGGALPKRKGSVLSVASNGSINSQASSSSSLGGSGGGGFFSKLKGKLMKSQEDVHSSTAALNTISNSKSRTYSELGRTRSHSTSSSNNNTTNINNTHNTEKANTIHESGPFPTSPNTNSNPSLFKSNYSVNTANSRRSTNNDDNDNGTVPLTRSRTTGGLKCSGGTANDGKCMYYSETNEKLHDISEYNSSHRLTRSKSFSSASGVEITDPRLIEYIKFFQIPCQRLRKSSMKKGSIQRARASISGLLTGQSSLTSSSPPEGSKFSFLRRKSVASTETSPPMSEATSMDDTKEESPDLVTEASNVLPEFKGIRPLKRVAFHLTTFLIDPPQQIPSRTPRKGNVDILPNGTVKINPLTDSDRIAIEKLLMGQGGGIVIGGSGALGYLKKDDNDESSTDSSNKTASVDPSDEAIDKRAKSLAIEKPIPTKAYSYRAPVKKMALDLMYTRCCHLREILPIPGILKQIPKGSMAPLPLLQLRNPTPTMVEIQTFADFIRIAPIVCVSLDGVSLSIEQFKILLSAMASKTQLEKLSLRNTPIDQNGWLLLCWFLSRNRVLNRLDITQCPVLAVNVIKKKKKKNLALGKEVDELVRMTCNRENRSDMDWSLFTATIVARGGINELILTGCCITDQELFENLVKFGVAIKTDRLGLAYNNLTPRQLKVVVTEWLMKPFCSGIDLGYNDLSSMAHLKVLTDLLRNSPDITKSLYESKILFISLNCTNLRFNDEFKFIFEELLMKLESLKYLDLSNNAKLFATGTKDEEAICQFFTDRLPLFPKLKRLHLENLNFSQDSLLSLSNIIPFCTNLGYLSLLGNKIDLGTATALIQALKNSQSLVTLDLDYEDYPHIFKERIGLYTMRNMERLLRNTHKSSPVGGDQITESDTLTAQLTHLLSLKAENKLDLKSPEVTAFVKKCNSVRANLTESINALLQIQLNNELNLEGKETLVRFLFINSTIAKGMSLIDLSLVEKEPQKFDIELFEDERKKNIKEEQEKFENEISANLLVPRPQPTIIEDEATTLKKNSSRTNLKDLNREEGSIMKLSKFKNQEMLDSMQDVSGEELRRTLYDINITDLDTIVKNLKMMKDKGISLQSVFPKGDGDLLDLDQIRIRLGQLAQDSCTNLDHSELDKLHPDVRGSGTMHGENGVSADGTETQKPELYTDHDSDADAIRLSLRRMLEKSLKAHGNLDGKIISEAYDSLLKTFAKFPKGLCLLPSKNEEQTKEDKQY